MLRFTILGIPIVVEPWFWLTLAFLGGGFDALQSNNAALYLNVALFVLAGFVSVLIHEMGHALMIKKYGLPTNIVLTAMGGYATYPAGRLDRKQSFLVTAAGPGVQIVFGLLVMFAIQAQLVMPSFALSSFVHYLVWVSIIWAVLNCLPIFPLDGGKMLSAILGPRRAKGVHITSIITAAAIGVWGLSMGSILITLFMGFFIYQNYQGYKQASS